MRGGNLDLVHRKAPLAKGNHHQPQLPVGEGLAGGHGDKVVDVDQVSTGGHRGSCRSVTDALGRGEPRL
eukprot:8598010-Lingulodinium_polyedra.AAC.1